MSENSSMTANERDRLSALANELRIAAKDAGSMSALWDTIFDIEAFLRGERTYLTKEAAQWIAHAEHILNARSTP